MEAYTNNILVSYFIPLPGPSNNSVSNLINYYMREENQSSYQNFLECTFCKNNNTKVEKVFLNTPNYLFIDFVGMNLIQKHLDEKLDLTEYKLTYRGPNKYSLYAYNI